MSPTYAFAYPVGSDHAHRVKALHDLDAQEPWSRLMDVVLEALFRHGAHWVIELPLNARLCRLALDNVAPVVRTLVAILRSHATVSERFGRGTVCQSEPRLHVPLGTARRHDEVRNNLRTSWVRRLRAVDGARVLVALTRNLFPTGGELDAARDVVAMLLKVLPRRRMLSAVMLYGAPFLPPASELLHVDPPWTFHATATEGLVRSALIINKEQAHHPLATAELEMFGRLELPLS